MQGSAAYIGSILRTDNAGIANKRQLNDVIRLEAKDRNHMKNLLLAAAPHKEIKHIILTIGGIEIRLHRHDNAPYLRQMHEMFKDMGLESHRKAIVGENPLGGFVAETAKVDTTAYVSFLSIVIDNVVLKPYAKVGGLFVYEGDQKIDNKSYFNGEAFWFSP